MQIAGYTRVTSPEFRGDPDRPDAWLQGRGELLRELPGRRVFRALIGGEAVVVKEYETQGIRRALRDCLRPYAQAEAENALSVAARGVPVVAPLAFARLGDGRQLLVLREEKGARPLRDVVLYGGPVGRARHELARRVAQLLAKMQNAGVRQRDHHAGNILVRPDGGVLLADARGLVAGSYPTPRERARDLAAFALFFLTHATSVDRLLFWGAYGRASGLMPDALEELRVQVQELLPAAFRRLVGERTRRARRHGTPLRIGPMEGLRFGEIPDTDLEAIVARATDLTPGPDVLKASRTAWTLAHGESCVFKVFLPKKATRPLRDLLFGSRAERALGAAEALAHRGLSTPEVLAVLDDRVLPGRSLLVMRRVRDALPLDVVIAGLAPRESRDLARRIGATLRRMHDWGLRHRDLKRDNLLVAMPAGGLCFLDVDGVQQTRFGPLDWEKRKRDLAHLGGSLLDRRTLPTGFRLRVLDAYLRGTIPPGHRAGQFARDVVRLAAQEEARRRGHGPR